MEQMTSTIDDAAMRARLEQLEQDVRRLLDNMVGFAGGAPASPGSMALALPRTAVAAPAAFGSAGFGTHAPATERRPGDAAPASAPAGRVRYVRRRIRQRRMRDQHFASDLFADPAWDMLLDLYAAHYERRPVSVSSLCIAAAGPATTALRWIKTLTDEGIFVRVADPHDGRRIHIYLSDDSRQRLDEYFDDIDDIDD